jgi:hypothetical protein
MLIGAAVPVALALLVPVMDEVPVVYVGMFVEVVSAPVVPVVFTEEVSVLDIAVSDEVPVAVLDLVEVAAEEALLDELDELLSQPDLMISILE